VIALKHSLGLSKSKIQMTISFKDIPENKRYGYCRVSSKEQARNSSLDTQKSKLT
jgi:hypothetical protein